MRQRRDGVNVYRRVVNRDRQHVEYVIYVQRLNVSDVRDARAYIASGATIAGNDSVILVAGVCLDPTNRYLVAHASNAAVHITAYGVTGP